MLGVLKIRPSLHTHAHSQRQPYVFHEGMKKQSSFLHFAPFLVYSGKQTSVAVNKMQFYFNLKGHLFLNVAVITTNMTAVVLAQKLIRTSG